MVARIRSIKASKSGKSVNISSEDQLDEWLLNRVYGVDVLERAAAGDVAAIAQVRTEAGLPLFS